MTELPPELATNYEILEKIDEGGMGIVYRARHRHLDQQCVIKVMHARLNDVSGARDRFYSEAKKGTQLHHPNIAGFLGFFVATDGKAYLVMEFVDGTDLRALLSKHGAMDAKTVVAIGVQALSALSYLHSRSLIHRDISPDNLILAADGDAPLVKLIDFGIAKSLNETSLTGTGSFIGKAVYASPEQFLKTVDGRSDLYSLGVVLYELLTGTRPMRETDPVAIIAASMRDEPPLPFSETDPQGRVPDRLREAVLKALQKNAANRFQTADDFAHALRNSLSSEHTTVIDAAPLPPVQSEHKHRPALPTVSEPSGSRRRALILVLAAALLIGGTAVSFRMWRKPAVSRTAPVEAAAGKPSTAEINVTSPATPAQQQAAADAITRGKQSASAGEIGKAYQAFGAAAKADPSNAYAWANLGGAAALLGKPDEARAAYDRALSIDPDNWLAHYNLACQLGRDGKRDEAFNHLEASVRELKRQARSRKEIATVVSSIRADEALGELRNDDRVAELLKVD